MDGVLENLLKTCEVLSDTSRILLDIVKKHGELLSIQEELIVDLTERLEKLEQRPHVDDLGRTHFFPPARPLDRTYPPTYPASPTTIPYTPNT